MWIRTLAAAAAALFSGMAVIGFLPALANLLFGLAGLATIGTVCLLVAPLLQRDPYDLGELQRVHDEEELREIDDEGALGDPEKVICLRCMTEYPFRLRACPRCGLSR